MVKRGQRNLCGRDAGSRETAVDPQRKVAPGLLPRPSAGQRTCAAFAEVQGVKHVLGEVLAAEPEASIDHAVSSAEPYRD